MLETILALWDRLDYDAVVLIKLGVAVAATVLLSWPLIGSQTSTPRRAALSDSLLGGLALVAFLSWWNFGHFHYPEYVQVHEHYHYYLGSKYFSELGYTRLYQCTAIADVEAGFGAKVADRWIRDLSTNELERGAVAVKDPSACTSHFSPARWDTFQKDVAWFRSHSSPEKWDSVPFDHGYNATPVWGIAGKLLTGDGPVTDRQILFLSLFDPALIVIMWAFVWWAFGWRTMCVGVIWWGTNYLSRYTWTGGAFLRTDWLAFAVIGVCLVKRNRPVAGGAALSYATLLRIFPGITIAGLALKAGIDMWKRRSWRLNPAHRDFAVGCVIAAGLLVGLSFVVVGRNAAGSIDAWEGFVSNSRKHLATPATNNVGLKTILSYEWTSRAAVLGPLWLDAPWDTWTAARRRVFDSRKLVYWAAIVASVPLLAFVVRNAEDWVALVMGIALIPVALQLGCYYYAVFSLLGLLWARSKWIGPTLCGLAAASIVAASLSRSDENVYTIESALVVLYAIGLIVVMIATDAGTKVLLRQKTHSEILGVEIGAKTVRTIENA
jgi:hypothetical protein